MAGTGWGSYSSISSSRRVQSYNAYTWSSDSTKCVYTVTGQARDGDGSGYYHASLYTAYVSIFYKVGSGSWTQIGTTKSGVLDGYGSAVGTVSGSVTINRTTAAQTIYFKTEVRSEGNAYWSVATTQSTDTLNALASYTISYNANSGSGAPSSQTKWYGKTLTLSGTKPTRTNYNFLGWGTSSTATTATYQPGGTYPASNNANATLYAVWKLAYKAPTISNLVVYRASDANGTADDEGTYAHMTFGWSVDTSISGNAGSKYLWAVKPKEVSSFGTDTEVPISGASGSVSVSLGSGSSVDGSYDVRLTVVDTSSNTINFTTKYAVLTPAFFTLDFGRDGHSIGVGTVASETENGVVFGSGMPVTLPKRDGTIERNTTNCSSLGTSWIGTNGVEASVSFIDATIKNALASSGNVVVATLPAGFRPRANRYICCVEKAGLWARITAGGEVRISNRTGASYAAGSTFTFSDSYYV